MLTIHQRIEYAAGALAAYRGSTSDQVMAELLGNRVRSQLERLAILEAELRRIRQPGQSVVKVLATV